jgi:hypothetical protein
MVEQKTVVALVEPLEARDQEFVELKEQQIAEGLLEPLELIFLL